MRPNAPALLLRMHPGLKPVRPALVPVPKARASGRRRTVVALSIAMDASASHVLPAFFEMSAQYLCGGEPSTALACL